MDRGGRGISRDDPVASVRPGGAEDLLSGIETVDDS